MNDHNQAPAAVDMADTGQWRLEATLWRGGITARLCAIDRPGVPTRPLLDARWRPDGEGLLQRFENAVYDNPQVLDDYTARILIDTPLLMWIPAGEIADEMTGAERFAEMFGGEADDVICDDSLEAGHRMLAFYTLCPGLKGFLGRTFPGARICCRQTRAVSDTLALASAGTDTVTLRLDCDSNYVHIVTAGPGGLISASTRPACTAPDIVYHALHALKMAGADAEEVCVRVTGTDTGTRDEVARILTDFCNPVIESAD